MIIFMLYAKIYRDSYLNNLENRLKYMTDKELEIELRFMKLNLHENELLKTKDSQERILNDIYISSIDLLNSEIKRRTGK